MTAKRRKFDAPRSQRGTRKMPELTYENYIKQRIEAAKQEKDVKNGR